MTGRDDTRWLDRPKNVQRLWRGFLVVLALTVAAEAFVHPHPTFAVESLFAFNAWFGLLSCAVMIVVARALGLLLKQRDDYYAEDFGPAEPAAPAERDD